MESSQIQLIPPKVSEGRWRDEILTAGREQCERHRSSPQELCYRLHLTDLRVAYPRNPGCRAGQK